MMDGKLHGFGILFGDDGRQEGEFNNNFSYGKCIQYENDSCFFQGYKINDKKNGIGIYHFFNGDRYEG